MPVSSPENALFPGCPCLLAVSDRFLNGLPCTTACCEITQIGCRMAQASWIHCNSMQISTEEPLLCICETGSFTFCFQLWYWKRKELTLPERTWGVELVFHRYAFRGIISPFPLIIKLVLSTQTIEIVYILWQAPKNRNLVQSQHGVSFYSETQDLQLYHH